MTQTAVASPTAPAASPVGEHVPQPLAAIVVEVAADNALAARLIHPRAEVCAALGVAIEKGAEIRARRIRYQEDLDEARLDKLAWTQAVNDLLTALFDGTAVADYCNDWVGKIFPEYAELGNFVEQFYDEMEYRLAKLRSVLQRVEQVVDAPRIPSRAPIEAPAAPQPALTPAPTPAPPAAVPPAAAAATVAAPAIPPPAAAAPAPVMQHSAAVAPAPLPGPGPAPSPAPSPAPAAPVAAVERAQPTAQVTPSHVMILGATASDPAYGPVATLLERLGVAAHPTTDPLSVGAADAAVFVAPAQAANAAAGRVEAFQLGCAVGRLGAHRVVVLHPMGAPPCPESGIAHLPADPGGGWQLQLARHLKQAGVSVDLNKLC